MRKILVLILVLSNIFYGFYSKKQFEIEEIKLNYADITFVKVLRHQASSRSELFQNIKKLIKNNKYDAIVLEGKGFDRYSSCLVNENECHNEPTFAYSLAKKTQKSTIVVSGEPKTEQVLKYLLKEGFTLEDYLAFKYTIKAMVLNRRKNITIQKLLPRLNRQRKYIENLVHKRLDFDYEKWQKWYKKKMYQKLDIYAINDNYINPNGENFLQKISHAVNIVRNQNLLDTIKNLTRKHKKILVIYGAQHIKDIWGRW